MAEKQDIQENAMAGGTPARLRGLDANGNSISPTLEEVASAGQGRVEYSIVGEGSVDIPLPYYGIFLFVSEELDGSSLLFHLAYYKEDFKAVIDSSNIVGNLFNIEQIKDGSKTIRVTNLRSSVQRFSINRL